MHYLCFVSLALCKIFLFLNKFQEIALEVVSVTGDGNEPPGTSLLDLTALESADSGVTSTTSDTDQGSSSTPGTDGASLIDF